MYPERKEKAVLAWLVLAAFRPAQRPLETQQWNRKTRCWLHMTVGLWSLEWHFRSGSSIGKNQCLGDDGIILRDDTY